MSTDTRELALQAAAKVADEYARQSGIQLNEFVLTEALGHAGLLAALRSPVERGEGEVGEAFYRLTVQQRDAAWREVEMLRARLDKLASLTNRYLNALANGEEDEGKYHELYNMAHRIVQFGPASPPAPVEGAAEKVRAALSLIDRELGDSDLPEDDRPLVDACQLLTAAIGALEGESAPAPVTGERERCPECGDDWCPDELNAACENAFHGPRQEMCGCVRRPGRWGTHLVSACPEHQAMLPAALPVQGELERPGWPAILNLPEMSDIPIPCSRCGEAVCECPEKPGDSDGLLAAYFAGGADARRDMRDLLDAALEWRERWADGASEGHSPEIDAAYRTACDALFEALRPFPQPEERETKWRYAGAPTDPSLAPSTNSSQISTSAPAPQPEEPITGPRTASPYSMIFDRLERYTPEQRAEAFYAIESRWCWDCGCEQSECNGCGSATPTPEEPA